MLSAHLTLSLLAAIDPSLITTTRVTDINELPARSDAAGFVRLGDTLFFTANDGAHGRELWRTNATSAEMVVDLFPGPEGSEPGELTVFDGALYFSAARSEYEGRSLWVTDGTSQGTHVFSPELVASYPRKLTLWRGELWFTAYDAGMSNDVLWHTDGTPEGSVAVAPWRATFNSIDVPFATIGNAFLVGYGEGENGVEPWVSDGTAEGTGELLDIMPGDDASYPTYFRGGANVAYFVADDGEHDREVWVTNGTAGGTFMVMDINPSGSSVYDYANPTDLTVLGDTLYFAGRSSDNDYEPWRCDSGPDECSRLADINVGAGPSYPNYFTAFDGDMYFGAASNARGLYVVAAGGMPTLVRTLGVSRIVSTGEHLVLSANANLGTGVELWVSDGTNGGTTMLPEIRPGEIGFDSADTGSNYGFAGDLFAAGDTVLTQANDGVHGLEPWVTDGTAQGTRLLADVRPGSASANVIHTFLASDRLYFIANDHTQSNKRLWVTDGTAEGTAPLFDCDDNQFYAKPLGAGFLFSKWTSATGYEPWFFDGESATLLELVEGSDASEPRQLTRLGDNVLFIANTPASGRELWISDGTEEGTHIVTELVAGTGDTNPVIRGVIGERAIFTLNGSFPAGGNEPWVTDGTASGTHLIKDILPGNDGVDPYYVAATPTHVYFTSYQAGLLPLYVTDGTEAGTSEITDGANSIAAVGERLFVYKSNKIWTLTDEQALVELPGAVMPNDGFRGGTSEGLAFYAGGDGHLWVSDGTAEGTRKITLPNSTLALDPDDVLVANGLAFFAGNTEAYGRELLRTDGTSEGTFVLTDIVAGAAGSYPEKLNVVGQRLVFEARDAAGDRELYTTSFTAVSDVTPPVITPVIDGTLGLEDWYVSAADVSFDVTDPESFIVSSTDCDAVSVTEDTEGVSFTCEASSIGGSASLTVTVKKDATAPVVVCPADLTLTAPGTLTYAVTATDALDAAPEVTVSPASGSSFAAGTHAVTGNAYDAAGNHASCTFTVTVTAPKKTQSGAAGSGCGCGSTDPGSFVLLGIAWVVKRLMRRRGR